MNTMKKIILFMFLSVCSVQAQTTSSITFVGSDSTGRPMRIRFDGWIVNEGDSVFRFGESVRARIDSVLKGSLAFIDSLIVNGNARVTDTLRIDILTQTDTMFSTTGRVYFKDNVEVADTTHTSALNIGSSTVIIEVLDEDDMASNSASALITQQSLVAFAVTKADTSLITRFIADSLQDADSIAALRSTILTKADTSLISRFIADSLQDADSIATLRTAISTKADTSLISRFIADSLQDADSIAALRTVVNNIEEAMGDSVRAIAPGIVGDSLANNIRPLIETKIDTTRFTIDSLYFVGIITATAGDTTSPGLTYAPDSATGKWFRADTSITVRAVAFAIDSVLPDASCRFKLWGIFSLARWSWTPGKALFSDSATAGEIGYGGQAVPKKMQLIGVALDTITVRCYFDPTITH